MNLISIIRDAFCCGRNQDMDDDDGQSLQNEEAAVISSEPSMVVLIWRSESDNIWEREAQSVHLENLSSVNGNDVKFYFSDDSGDEQHYRKEETHPSNVTINGGNLLPGQESGNQMSAIDPELKLDALEDKATGEEKVHTDVMVDQPETENMKKTTDMIEELTDDKKHASNINSVPVNSHVKNAVHRFETQLNANKGSVQQMRRTASGLGGKYNSLAETKLSLYATDVIETHPVVSEVFELTASGVVNSTEVPLAQVPLLHHVSAIETGPITEDEAEKPTTSCKPMAKILPGASTDNVFMQYEGANTFDSTVLKDTDGCEEHKDENDSENE